MNEWRILVYLFAFILYFSMTKWRLFILFKIDWLELQTLVANWTKSTSVGPPPITGRPSNGELPVIGGLIFVRRSPPGVLTMAAGALAENFGYSARKSGSGQTVSRRRSSCGRWMVYDIVQGQENRPTSYRSRKIDIWQKSSGHRWIYVQLGRRL